ncbi:MAG: YHS domain-containing protein [Myxococcaceae bacterium]
MAKPNEPSGRGPYDPICGRALSPETDRCSVEYKKRTYYFCSEKCREAFQHRTEKFRLNELARAGALLTPGRVRWGLA